MLRLQDAVLTREDDRDDSFYLDIQGIGETSATDVLSQPTIAIDQNATQDPSPEPELPPLLLPDHVFMSTMARVSKDPNGDQLEVPPSPTFSRTSDIQFIDDDRPVSRILR